MFSFFTKDVFSPPAQRNPAPSGAKEQLLWEACTDGNLELAKELTKDGTVNVNWIGEDKKDSPLHRACRFGHLEIVRVLLAHPKIDVNLGNWGEASAFYLACQEGHLEVVRLLLGDPRVEPTKAGDEEDTPLYIASQNGHVKVVSLLLADHRTRPNHPTKAGATSFYIACQEGQEAVVALLLSDPRINPNQQTNDHSTPLWFASQNGYLGVVRVILASDRIISVGVRTTWNNTTAAEQARWAAAQPRRWDNVSGDDPERRRANCATIAELIDKYERDPVAVRLRLREGPRVRGYYVGPLFALVVFFADGFLRATAATPPETERFLVICSRLPLDLQMVLCNRLYGSAKSIVPGRDSEPGFRWLGRPTVWAFS